MNTDSNGLDTWKCIWYICMGATSVLAVQSINQLPSLSAYQITFLEWFVNPLYSGLIWAMIALEVACIVSGLFLLLAPGVRHIRWQRRINWGFGFFILGWVAALSFFVRLDYEIPTFLLWIAVAALAVLAGLYWFLRHRMDVQEDIFP